MSALSWTEVRGQKFTVEEAGEASDFSEVLLNFGMDAEMGYNMFGKDHDLTVGKRLFFAERLPLDMATTILLLDEDERVRGVIDERLRKQRLEENGGLFT